MKTKFKNISKEFGREFFQKALDAYYTYPDNLVTDAKRLRYNDKATEGYYIYKLTEYQHMRFYRSPGMTEPYRIEFVSAYEDGGTVTFMVTGEDWPRKLFSNLYGMGVIDVELKKHMAAN